jgi:phosphoribosylformylglycinamidine cyclo-ligase
MDEFGSTLGEELLKPTRIYSESLLNLSKNFKVSGFVHITGGGFIDNIPRILPQGSRAIIHYESWEIPPIFKFLQEKGNITAKEMCRTFNMGIGMVAVIDENIVDDFMQQLTALGETPYHLGEITARPDTPGSSQIEIDCF